MLQELSYNELLEIEGGLSAYQWGHMFGHALGTTMYECAVIFGSVAIFI